MSEHATVELLATRQAAAYLCRSESTVNHLRQIGVLEPDPAMLDCGYGEWAYQYPKSRLDAVKPCLDTETDLRAEGHAKPVDGHLWVIEKTAEGKLQLTDLCSRNWTDAYTLHKVAKKFGVTDSRLKKAGACNQLDLVTDRHGWILACSARVAKFLNDHAPTKQLPGFAPTSRLTAMVGAVTLTEQCEVSECASHWAELGWLRKRCVATKQTGKVPAAWKLAVDGKRKITSFSAVEKIYGQTQYDTKTFCELWQEPLDDHVSTVKKLVRQDGIEARELHAKLRALGITGNRLKRVLRLADATRICPRVGEPWLYVLGQKSRAPKKPRPLRIAVKWLKKQLGQGPRLVAELVRLAAKVGINGTALARARNVLKCKRNYVRAAKASPDKEHGGRQAFWHLPDQGPPSPAEAGKAIAEYRATNRSANHGTPSVDDSPAKKTRCGRKKGWRDPQVVERKKRMLDAWDRQEYGTNKAAYGRKFGFNRADASRILKAHIAQKSVEIMS